MARPTRLTSTDAAWPRRIEAGIEGDGRSHGEVIRDVFDFLKSVGAPAAASEGAVAGRPSDRDLRVATAMQAQLASLGTKGTVLDLGEDAQLSPRQLQRVVNDFNVRTRGGSWKQRALARGFDLAGLPPPVKLRQTLLQQAKQ